jgi:hypothetical protein
MNNENILSARELLINTEPGEVISTQVNHERNTRTEYYKCPANVIEDLVNSKLLVLSDVISISIQSSIEVFKVSELGEQLSEFKNLAEWYSEGVHGEEQFIKTGEAIYKVIDKFTEEEIEPLVYLLTDEEQDAYSRFYRMFALNNYQEKNNKNELLLSDGLITMFNLSVELGTKGSDETRTNNYVFKKCMEELGEMALEDNIALGLSYKNAGSDGVAGEAVDLAICAMDMFALQYPNTTAEEIQNLFILYMNKKLNKWKATLNQ